MDIHNRIARVQQYPLLFLPLLLPILPHFPSIQPLPFFIVLVLRVFSSTTVFCSTYLLLFHPFPSGYHRIIHSQIIIEYSEHLHYFQLSRIFQKYHNFGPPFLTNHVPHNKTTYIPVIRVSNHIAHSIKHPVPD